MPSSKSLPLSGTESEIERMTNLEKFGLQPYTLEPTKSKIPVGYGRISGSDLASSNDVATICVLVELATKPGANVNAVLRWKLA